MDVANKLERSGIPRWQLKIWSICRLCQVGNDFSVPCFAYQWYHFACLNFTRFTFPQNYQRLSLTYARLEVKILQSLLLIKPQRQLLKIQTTRPQDSSETTFMYNIVHEYQYNRNMQFFVLIFVVSLALNIVFIPANEQFRFSLAQNKPYLDVNLQKIIEN